MRIFYILCFLFVSSSNLVQAQILVLDPAQPTVNDFVTITYDASEGNGNLAGFSGDIYAHTGVLTANSDNETEWFYVVADWNQNLPELQMTPLGNDLYEISFQISDFYSIPPNEEVLALAFVFRNENGTIVGKEADESDIIYYLNKYQPSSYVDHNIFESVLEVFADQGVIHIRPFTEEIVKVEVFSNGQPQMNPSYSTILSQQPVPFSFSDEGAYLRYFTGAIEVLVQKDPLFLVFVQDGDTLLQENPGFTSFNDIVKQYEFKISDSEALYGTGSRAIDIDLKGRKLEVYNEPMYGYANNTDQLNICAPFVVSNRGYGLFMDNSWKATWDLGAENPELLRYRALGGPLPYYFIGGRSMERVMENYHLLTGYQPVPPRWSLGYIQSKFGYENQAEAEAVVADLLQNDFPLDALVLDLYWFGDPSTMGNLEWDYTRFPDPVGMIDNFKDQGIQTILITEPYFTTQSSHFDFLSDQSYLGTNPDGETYVLDNFWAGPAGLLDITNPDALDWMWDFYDARNQEGVGGWWCDLGEPELQPLDMQFQDGSPTIENHNIYSLLWAKMLYEKHQENYPGLRLFNLIRSGYSGFQRYSTFPWSGDVARNFSGLRAQIPIMVNSSLSGFSYMSSDLGGFVGGGMDDELFIRWMQLGVFSPIMRVHGAGIDTEPTAYSQEAQDISRDLIQKRYDLLPYIYSLAYENSIKGTPIIRPTNFDLGEDETLKNINDQFLFGKDILVAPALYPNQTERMVWLPTDEEVWYNPDLVEKSYSSNNPVSMPLPYEEVNYFIRNGGIIPEVRNLKNTESYNTDTLWLTVQVYEKEGLDNQFILYDDDGLSANSLADSLFQTIEFNLYNNNYGIELEIIPNGDFPGKPAVRDLYFEFIIDVVYKDNKVVQDGELLNEYSFIYDYLESEVGHHTEKLNDEFAKLRVHVKLEDEPTILYIDLDNFGSTEDLKAEVIPPPFFVYPVGPNPIEDQLEINYTLAESDQLNFELYTVHGQLLNQERTDKLAPGNHELEWNIGHLAAGTYLLNVNNGQHQQVEKLIVIR